MIKDQEEEGAKEQRENKEEEEIGDCSLHR